MAINPKITAFYKMRVERDKQTIDTVPTKYQDPVMSEISSGDDPVLVEQVSTPDIETSEFTVETATTESMV